MSERSSTNQPWKTANWFVSEWNFLEEVTKDFAPPAKVKIHDITLRDGEQQAGIIFTKDDKIRIAEKLSEAGIHRIEAGMPAVSPRDEAAIREIVKRNLPSEIFCFCRCMVKDVELAADCGVKGIVIEIPASKHLIEQGYQWPLEKAIDLSIKATAYAKEKGLYTVFFTIDATRSDLQWLLNLVERVATEGHMDAFTLVDTFGVLSPHAATYFTKKVKERVSKPLEIHFHSDFGMGVANTINSVLAGAEVIHSTVLGIGERAGNTPMEETVLALLTMYGIDVGINYRKLNELSKLVQDLAGVKVPVSRPFIGDGAYTIESGIVTGWYKNAYASNPTTVFPVHPDFVGHAPLAGSVNRCLAGIAGNNGRADVDRVVQICGDIGEIHADDSPAPHHVITGSWVKGDRVEVCPGPHGDNRIKKGIRAGVDGVRRPVVGTGAEMTAGTGHLAVAARLLAPEEGLPEPDGRVLIDNGTPCRLRDWRAEPFRCRRRYDSRT